MQQKDDQYYLEQTRKGDLQAFSVLVGKYEKMVFTLCLRMLKIREEAEEAAQDSFIKVYQHLSSFKGDSKFSTWLYKITYHECLGKLRKKKIHFELNEEITPEDENHIHWENGLEILVKEEREKAIRKAIESLSSNEAAVITLFYMDELSIKEISAITSLSESNIKVVLHRGRKNLTKTLLDLSEKKLVDIK
ncbi:RNA polymerase sigma factor [Algoriphagus boseongensis]|nr:sigma-70 family RNA polymerase sigma factor [Algoriphagus boseongensis]